MKTTIEIADALLAEARKAAEKDGVTLRTLVEDSLRRSLKARHSAAFRLARASFGGQGLQPGVREGSWDVVRELIYEGRGA